VYDNPAGEYEVRWYERAGDDLAMHSDPDECERCAALLAGGIPRNAQTVVDLPDDAKEAFFTVVATIGRLDEETP
jgi:hypothetical protein